MVYFKNASVTYKLKCNQLSHIIFCYNLKRKQPFIWYILWNINRTVLFSLVERLPPTILKVLLKCMFGFLDIMNKISKKEKDKESIKI